MPYQTPKTWAFGNTIQAADLQKYSSNLTWWQTNLAAVPPQASGPAGTVVLRNAHRWLAYLPDSEDDAPTLALLRDATGEYETSLETATADGKVKWFDLESLDWLVVGMTYMVTDVLFAREVASLE